MIPEQTSPMVDIIINFLRKASRPTGGATGFDSPFESQRQRYQKFHVRDFWLSLVRRAFEEMVHGEIDSY